MVYKCYLYIKYKYFFRNHRIRVTLHLAAYIFELKLKIKQNQYFKTLALNEISLANPTTPLSILSILDGRMMNLLVLLPLQ
jgi:hypothetical protein